VVPLRDGSISHLKSSRKDDILATASCKKKYVSPTTLSLLIANI